MVNPIAGVGAFMHHARLQRAGVGAFMHHFQQRFVYYRFYLRKRKRAARCAPAKLYTACTKLFTTMARLSSNPEFLLEYLHDIPDESDSDEDFDGYLDADEGPVAYRSVAEFEEESAHAPRRSLSLDDLSESPLSELSPSHSPMQGEHASGSPLAGNSPTQFHTTAAASSSTLTSQVLL